MNIGKPIRIYEAPAIPKEEPKPAQVQVPAVSRLAVETIQHYFQSSMEQ